MANDLHTILDRLRHGDCAECGAEHAPCSTSVRGTVRAACPECCTHPECGDSAGDP